MKNNNKASMEYKTMVNAHKLKKMQNQYKILFQRRFY